MRRYQQRKRERDADTYKHTSIQIITCKWEDIKRERCDITSERTVANVRQAWEERGKNRQNGDNINYLVRAATPWYYRENARQNFTLWHMIYTSRGPLFHRQKHCQECPCSVGGTKSYIRHTQPFYLHFPRASGRNSEGLLTGCVWHQQSYAH